MRILYLSPNFPNEQKLFVRGLKEAGATVLGVGNTPREKLGDDLAPYLDDYLCVSNLLDEQLVIAAVTEWLKGKKPVDRVEALVEAIMIVAARLREAIGAAGLTYEQTLLFRDKDLMKARVREAGLRVPRSRRVRNAHELHAAAEEIGFPIIVKPIKGVGALDTYLLRDSAELADALPRLLHVEECNVEEVIFGEELTFDTICAKGRPLFYNVSQYFPPIIESSHNEWISPADFTYRDPDSPKFAAGVKLGKAVLKALGMTTGFTHMEWFLTGTGEAVFGEIAARSPGGFLVDLMNYANDWDAGRQWAQAVVHGRLSETPQRRFNTVMIFKRAIGVGPIRHYDGLDRVRQRCGEALFWQDLAPIGSPRRDWRRDPRADGFVAIRHPDVREATAMMQYIASELKLIAD